MFLSVLYFNINSPDCRRLKSNISGSSSISWGGCSDAERVEGPFGTVTAKSDIDDEGVESIDFMGTFNGCSLKAEDVDASKASIFSVASISEAPLPVASGILFKGLIEEVECRCLLEL